MNKNIKLLIFRICAILLISVIIAELITPLFIEKRTELPYNVTTKVRGFYEEPEDSLDIIFVGSSDLFTTMNPLVIWEEQGITSYMLGANEQGWNLSYYYIAEALKYQKPETVVLDVFYCAYDKEQRDAVIRINTDDMKWGLNKASAIMANAQPDQWYSFFFPLARYHDRWKDISIDELKKIDGDPLKGWSPIGQIEEFPEEGVLWSEGVALDMPDIYSEVQEEPLPEVTLQWLDRIQELCNRSGVELILLLTPNNNLITLPPKDDEGFVQVDGSNFYKALATEAKKRNLTFVNMNSVMNGNYHNDATTACRASSWFGRWYVSNHNVEDKRGNENYSQWDLDVEYTYEIIQR